MRSGAGSMSTLSMMQAAIRTASPGASPFVGSSIARKLWATVDEPNRVGRDHQEGGERDEQHHHVAEQQVADAPSCQGTGPGHEGSDREPSAVDQNQKPCKGSREN